MYTIYPIIYYFTISFNFFIFLFFLYFSSKTFFFSKIINFFFKNYLL
jgi:hypothetical protein